MLWQHCTLPRYTAAERGTLVGTVQICCQTTIGIIMRYPLVCNSNLSSAPERHTAVPAARHEKREAGVECDTGDTIHVTFQRRGARFFFSELAVEPPHPRGLVVAARGKKRQCWMKRERPYAGRVAL